MTVLPSQTVALKMRRELMFWVGIASKLHKRRKAVVKKRAAVKRVVRVCLKRYWVGAHFTIFSLSLSLYVVGHHQSKVQCPGRDIGFFYHVKNVPEKVFQVLHQLGLSDFTQSIQNAINSMSQGVRQRIYDMGRTLLCSVAYDNFNVYAHTDAPTLE